MLGSGKGPSLKSTVSLSGFGLIIIKGLSHNLGKASAKLYYQYCTICMSYFWLALPSMASLLPAGVSPVFLEKKLQVNHHPNAFFTTLTPFLD